MSLHYGMQIHSNLKEQPSRGHCYRAQHSTTSVIVKLFASHITNGNIAAYCAPRSVTHNQNSLMWQDGSKHMSKIVQDAPNATTSYAWCGDYHAELGFH